MKKVLTLIAVTFYVTLIAINCSNETEKQTAPAPIYLNHHDTVKYVGITVCRGCHYKVYEDFIHTGMGQSFDIASRQKSAASFGEDALVYDEYSDLYYKPFWSNDSLMIMEFRLKDGDTIHKRIEQVSYIIGSGQHTNSHIVNFHGYLYQAPITYYTQRGVWDLAPGFERGNNSRFSRIIGLECMTCHNAYPDFAVGSENKYISVKTGIDCERCHGPGELHVKEKRAGNIIDTSKYIDHTIVNPAKLPIALQMSLCKRCHLQGITVLQDGKSFRDFKPGMDLAAVMNIFMPKFAGADDEFIMASHVERLMQSQCFKQSKKISCITCHNPHVSVKFTKSQIFNNTCISCHDIPKSPIHQSTNHQITKSPNHQMDCVKCHMPKSTSIDIPHVSITDHKIQIPISDTAISKIKEFIGLVCLTNENPSHNTIAKGYLAYYEKFGFVSNALDSAEKYLLMENGKWEMGNGKEKKKMKRYRQQLKEIIHLYYLRHDMNKVILFAGNFDIDSIADSWTCYRVGEAYYQLARYEEALKYFKKAVKLKPLHLDFQNKLGSAYMQSGDLQKAKNTFEFIITENPKYVPAISNLGYLYLILNRPDRAKILYDKAINLDPDNEPALLNIAGWYIYHEESQKAKSILLRVLQINPDNARAKQVLRQISGIK
ncbi:MAG: tetratricopeptide repeat protein [Cytophagales bacterium]|nr:tetratricopeptide repeat protein [Cytophagales bacterium]